MGEFNLATLITMNGSGFWEYESVEHFVEDNGKDKIKDILAYFPPYKNIDMKAQIDNVPHLICYISTSSENVCEHLIVKANDKFDLLTQYYNLIQSGQDENYINVYKLDDLEYI